MSKITGVSTCTMNSPNARESNRVQHMIKRNQLLTHLFHTEVQYSHPSNCTRTGWRQWHRWRYCSTGHCHMALVMELELTNFQCIFIMGKSHIHVYKQTMEVKCPCRCILLGVVIVYLWLPLSHIYVKFYRSMCKDTVYLILLI